ncbi:MAG: hypothetical protein Q9163_006358 [Psora crenata]
MAMTLDHGGDRHLGSLGYDHMSYGNGPPFTNPWVPSNTQLFTTGAMNTTNVAFDPIHKQQNPRVATTQLPYSSLSAAAAAPSMNAGAYSSQQYPQSDLMSMTQDLINHSRPAVYDQGYSTAPASVASFAPTSAPYTSSYGTVAQAPPPPPPSQQEEPRRLSHSSLSSSSRAQPTYTDALDSGRGMVAPSEDLTTPRNIYGGANRGSTDAYGFPAAHSAHSSISSASYGGPSSYYSGSVDSSVSDYGSQSDMESVSSRTLPRPTGLIGGSGLPPPQSMMSQFNSKISSSAQKKHKCKVCDKRFTRPSSLQTHMYSHTGEKPYACEAEGCGRHFSVVSNLRRHRKVHKGGRNSDSDQLSPDGL